MHEKREMGGRGYYSLAISSTRGGRDGKRREGGAMLVDCRVDREKKKALF